MNPSTPANRILIVFALSSSCLPSSGPCSDVVAVIGNGASSVGGGVCWYSPVGRDVGTSGGIEEGGTSSASLAGCDVLDIEVARGEGFLCGVFPFFVADRDDASDLTDFGDGGGRGVDTCDGASADSSMDGSSPFGVIG